LGAEGPAGSAGATGATFLRDGSVPRGILKRMVLGGSSGRSGWLIKVSPFLYRHANRVRNLNAV
jgi:hypothetical protein